MVKNYSTTRLLQISSIGNPLDRRIFHPTATNPALIGTLTNVCVVGSI